MSDLEARFGAQPVEDPHPGRRQLDELTGGDLRAQPVWWFPPADGRLGGPDAATVMPVEWSASDDGSVEFPDGKYLLHAAFTLADGTALDGHVTFVPGDRGTIAEREPTLCAPGGQVPLWIGALAVTDAQVRDWLARTGRARGQVFPLRWRTTLHPPGAEISGEAEGFAVLRDGVVRFV